VWSVTMADDMVPQVRRARHVRLVEDTKGVSVYPEPHRVPVLPSGWAPLDRADQEAVMAACDANPRACRLRFGSPWDPTIEYRVYVLDVDAWRGVCAATAFSTGPVNGTHHTSGGANVRLLAVARDIENAARVAVDFLNWDLEAEGLRWRVAVSAADAETRS